MLVQNYLKNKIKVADIDIATAGGLCVPAAPSSKTRDGKLPRHLV
jgi:hypothetical protein